MWIASDSCSLWLQSDDHFYMRRQHGQGDTFPIGDQPDRVATSGGSAGPGANNARSLQPRQD
jgi:hypothetical protein